MPASTTQPLAVAEKLMRRILFRVCAAVGLFFMPASTTQPLAVAEKLLAEAPLPLHASQAMLPPRDPLFAKHWVLLQDVGAPDMDDAR
jgi:hypothetical protein